MAIEFNHGDKVKTKDGSGHGVVLSHDGKNAYGDDLILVKWDNGKEFAITQANLVHENVSEIVIQQECEIPGTGIILEKGDIINVIEKHEVVKESTAPIFENNNFAFMSYPDNSGLFINKVVIKPNSLAEKYGVGIKIVQHCVTRANKFIYITWDAFHVPYGGVEQKNSKALQWTTKGLFDAINDAKVFANKVANYLSIEVLN